MKNVIRFAMLVVFAALVGMAVRSALEASPAPMPFIRMIDMYSMSAEPVTANTEATINVSPVIITHKRAATPKVAPCVIDWRPLEQGRGLVRSTGICPDARGLR